jgi:hypothetical protein
MAGGLTPGSLSLVLCRLAGLRRLWQACGSTAAQSCRAGSYAPDMTHPSFRRATISAWFRCAASIRPQLWKGVDACQVLGACAALQLNPPNGLLQMMVSVLRRDAHHISLRRLAGVLEALACMKHSPGWQFMLAVYQSTSMKQQAIPSPCSKASAAAACAAELASLSQLVSALAALKQRPLVNWTEWLLGRVSEIFSSELGHEPDIEVAFNSAAADLLCSMFRLHIVPGEDLLTQLVTAAKATVSSLPAGRALQLLGCASRLVENRLGAGIRMLQRAAQRHPGQLQAGGQMKKAAQRRRVRLQLGLTRTVSDQRASGTDVAQLSSTAPKPKPFTSRRWRVRCLTLHRVQHARDFSAPAATSVPDPSQVTAATPNHGLIQALQELLSVTLRDTSSRVAAGGQHAPHVRSLVPGVRVLIRHSSLQVAVQHDLRSWLCAWLRCKLNEGSGKLVFSDWLELSSVTALLPLAASPWLRDDSCEASCDLQGEARQVLSSLLSRAAASTSAVHCPPAQLLSVLQLAAFTAPAAGHSAELVNGLCCCIEGSLVSATVVSMGRSRRQGRPTKLPVMHALQLGVAVARFLELAGGRGSAVLSPAALALVLERVQEGMNRMLPRHRAIAMHVQSLLSAK